MIITHDLAGAVMLADRIAVMYFGRIVEEGPARQVMDAPVHPYTRALVSAIPSPDPAVQMQFDAPADGAAGELPDAVHPPPGCAFASRCPVVEPACRDTIPVLIEVASGHRAACILAARG